MTNPLITKTFRSVVQCMLQISKQDWLVWMVVFLGCLFVGIDWGLAFGVGLAVLVQLGHITFPRLQLLGRIPGTTSFRQGSVCCINLCMHVSMLTLASRLRALLVNHTSQSPFEQWRRLHEDATSEQMCTSHTMGLKFLT